MDYQVTPQQTGKRPIIANGPKVPTYVPRVLAEAHMCVCSHSQGAHKRRDPHPCGLCNCARYRDGAELVAAAAANKPLSQDATRALDLLARNPAFAGVASEHLKALAACSHRHLLLAGTVLMTEGMSSDRVYILTRGTVRVERGIDYPVPQLLARLGPGELVGEMGVLRNAPRSATVTAEEDLEVLEIDIDDLRAVFRQEPRLLLALARVMHDRLKQ